MCLKSLWYNLNIVENQPTIYFLYHLSAHDFLHPVLFGNYPNKNAICTGMQRIRPWVNVKCNSGLKIACRISFLPNIIFKLKLPNIIETMQLTRLTRLISSKISFGGHVYHTWWTESIWRAQCVMTYFWCQGIFWGILMYQSILLHSGRQFDNFLMKLSISYLHVHDLY